MLLSPPAYLMCVALVTLLAIGMMMLFRPAFLHSVLDLLGLQAHPQVAPNSFYAMRVAPILEEHCVGCHGRSRQKGKLRLDSYGGILLGGKDGPVIKPGNLSASLLFARLNLPASDDRLMPPSSKPTLSGDDVTIIKLWIAAGASAVQAVSQFKGAPPPVAKVTFEEIDEVAVHRARAAQAQLVKQLQSKYPGIIQYESRASANLEVNAAIAGLSFGDADLKALAPLSDHIVWADFSGTSVNDALDTVLLAMKRLRTLRLNNVAVKDSTILQVRSLAALQSLTVVGTSVSAATVRSLRMKGVKVYDGNNG